MRVPVSKNSDLGLRRLSPLGLSAAVYMTKSRLLASESVGTYHSLCHDSQDINLANIINSSCNLSDSVSVLTLVLVVSVAIIV